MSGAVQAQVSGAMDAASDEESESSITDADTSIDSEVEVELEVTAPTPEAHASGVAKKESKSSNSESIFLDLGGTAGFKRGEDGRFVSGMRAGADDTPNNATAQARRAGPLAEGRRRRRLRLALVCCLEVRVLDTL